MKKISLIVTLLLLPYYFATITAQQNSIRFDKESGFYNIFFGSMYCWTCESKEKAREHIKRQKKFKAELQK